MRIKVLDITRSGVKARGSGLLAIFFVFLIIATGCQSSSAESAPVTVEATQPPPTATPIPPTTVPEPSPTFAEEAVPEVITIPFADPDTAKDITLLSRWLKVYYPVDTSAPYPAIFMLPGWSYPPSQYKRVVEAFRARGYAVVLVNYRTKSRAEEAFDYPGGNDIHCALAWVVAEGRTYDLDMDRWVVFGHTYGGMMAMMMALEDEAVWADALTGCSYPQPARGAVKGVVTYDALMGMPDGALQTHVGSFAQLWNVSPVELSGMMETLNETQPFLWHKPDMLNENTYKLAQQLPLYWIHHPDALRYAPPFLFIYDDSVGRSDWSAETSGGLEVVPK